MHFTFYQSNFFVLPSNILGIECIEKAIDLFASCPATSVLHLPWLETSNEVAVIEITWSRGRKKLSGYYWKYYHIHSFYHMSCITVVVTFFRSICWSDRWEQNGHQIIIISKLKKPELTELNRFVIKLRNLSIQNLA